MRLLNAHTLHLEEEYFDDNIPPYAILSHRWRHGEVRFQDIQPLSSAAPGSRPESKHGYQKILQACRRAWEYDSLHHVWIDTCCIDKSSSAELSESINSMFRWYQAARICYVYLDDVDLLPDPREQAGALVRSEWFQRGWTLQELLAPRNLLFFSKDWSLLGSKDDFLDAIEGRTRIDRQFLVSLWSPMSSSPEIGRSYLQRASVAERMSWASDRKTTKPEDMAYCLLGIFNIAMPLLYGEGEAAFIRLQEEILKQTGDQTLLAWNPLQSSWRVSSNPTDGEAAYLGIFARSPAVFAGCSNLIPRRAEYDSSSISSVYRGITIRAPCLFNNTQRQYIMLLCGPRDDPTIMMALPLRTINGSQYTREMAAPVRASYAECQWWPHRSIQIMQQPASSAHDRGSTRGGVWLRSIPDTMCLGAAVPLERWSARDKLWNIPMNRHHISADAAGDYLPSIILKPQKRWLGLPAVRLSVEILPMARLLSALGFGHYRAVLTVTESPKRDSRRGSREPHKKRYLQYSNDIILHARVRFETILGKHFLLIDVVEMETRGHVPVWLILQGSSDEKLAAFASTLSASAIARLLVEFAPLSRRGFEFFSFALVEVALLTINIMVIVTLTPSRNRLLQRYRSSSGDTSATLVETLYLLLANSVVWHVHLVSNYALFCFVSWWSGVRVTLRAAILPTIHWAFVVFLSQYVSPLVVLFTFILTALCSGLEFTTWIQTRVLALPATRQRKGVNFILRIFWITWVVIFLMPTVPLSG